MPIESDQLLKFNNEKLRPLADKLAGLLDIPRNILAEFKGKGLATVAGFEQDLVEQLEPLTEQDYGKIPLENLVGSDLEGRTTIYNHHILSLLRALRFLDYSLNSDPTFRELVLRFAVNPRF